MEALTCGLPEHNYEKYYSLKNGDVFVEGGAFFGRYANIASKKVGVKGKIIAIEPSPLNTPILRGNTDKLGNVTVIEKALWSSEGLARFWINPDSEKVRWSAHKLAVLKSHGFGEHVEVKVDTLDNILTSFEIEKVDLLAWDVEGSGMEALKGTKNFLESNKILNLALCFYHRSLYESVEEASKIIEGYGYKILEKEGIVYATL